MSIVIAIIAPIISAITVALIVSSCAAAKRAEEAQEWQETYDEMMNSYESRIIVLKAQNDELLRRYTGVQKENDELKARDNDTIIAELEAENKKYMEKIKELTLPDKEAIPDGATNMYMCMDYRKITNKKSYQWLLQEKCTTNTENGIRQYDEYYTVAMAANYGRSIGDCWRVTLNNGNEFYIMLGDFKDDGKDPYRMGDPCHNYDEQDCTNVIEFIVDMDVVPNNVKKAGTMSELEFFGGKYGDGGNIVKMEYLGFADWKGNKYGLLRR